MSKNRPFVLTIAGFDPSGGAGVLADIKTFEQHRVYGLAVNTANTIQTEDAFFTIEWVELDFVLQSIQKLFDRYDIKAIKIGIIPTLDYLIAILQLIKKKSPKIKIVWDPVLKSTTNFDFIRIEDQNKFINALEYLEVITPNFEEIAQIGNGVKEIETIVKKITEKTNLLLKGGHNPNEIGVDYLYIKKTKLKLEPKTTVVSQKHGSGCVLSSAITANIALGMKLETACINAKTYIEKYLNTNITLLGYHYV
jgi:hydroxymethylpyrimidine/phosphomethylpyrimidine kinase